MDTIEGMRTFIAVARQASFTGGAKQLGMTTKLASKYVRQLEEKLGAQLLNRTTRSVTLTETGEAYFDQCIPILDQLEELEGLVQQKQSELAGPIRITAPTGFGSIQLVEALRPFQEQHPKVMVDLHLSDHHVSIIDGGFDLAIRFSPLETSSLIARRLMDMRVVCYASPDYLARQSAPTMPQDLTQHNCLLQKTSSDPENWTFKINGKRMKVKVHGSFRANAPRAIGEMAADGLGIGVGPIYSIESHLASGKLQLILEDYEATLLSLNAVYPPGRHLTARIRALIDHLVEFFGNDIL